MIFSRLLSLILRVAQFVFAVVVLGLTAYFMHERTRRGIGPFARTIFAIVWSSLSIIFSIVWMIPTKSTMASYGSDLRKSLSLLTLVMQQRWTNAHQSSQQAGPPSSRCWSSGSTALDAVVSTLR